LITQQWALGIDVKKRAAQQCTRLLPAVEPVAGGHESQLAAPLPTGRRRQSLNARFAVIALGTLGRDQQVLRSPEFIIERLTPNAVDLLRLNHAPIGALALNDRLGGDDRKMPIVQPRPD